VRKVRQHSAKSPHPQAGFAVRLDKTTKFFWHRLCNTLLTLCICFANGGEASALDKGVLRMFTHARTPFFMAFFQDEHDEQNAVYSVTTSVPAG
jgi:hypothetical protein